MNHDPDRAMSPDARRVFGQVPRSSSGQGTPKSAKVGQNISYMNLGGKSGPDVGDRV